MLHAEHKTSIHPLFPSPVLLDLELCQSCRERRESMGRCHFGQARTKNFAVEVLGMFTSADAKTLRSWLLSCQAILSHDSLRKICPSGLFQLFLNLETDL